MPEHLEIEQKFDIDEEFERPAFGSLDGVTAAGPVLYRLSAVYFDTADGRLAAGKITLRRRTGGTDAGWHLKLPAGAGRREVQEPLTAPGTADSAVPQVLAARVAEVTGGLPLAPIAALDTERTVVRLTGADGRALAEVADDVVTGRRLVPGPGTDGAPAPSGETVRWREIEVEVATANPGLQRAAARLLLAAGARPAGHGSKLARLLNG